MDKMDRAAADHSCLYKDKFKTAWCYTSILPHAHSVMPNKARGMNSPVPFPNSPAISPKWFDHIMQTKKDKWAKLILIYNMDNCLSTHSSVPLKRHVTGGGATNVFHLVRQL